MPFGFSDQSTDASGSTYGAPGFIAAMATILALEFLTAFCLLAWYLVPVIAVPATIVVALVGWGLTRTRGAVAQVGSGMLVGATSAPLTLVILIPTYLAARAAGLV